MLGSGAVTYFFSNNLGLLQQRLEPRSPTAEAITLIHRSDHVGVKQWYYNEPLVKGLFAPFLYKEFMVMIGPVVVLAQLN